MGNLKRRLGESGLTVNPLGIGCWSFGGGEYWGDQSQNDVDRLVLTALDNDINFFDTAEMYNDGKSELSLGKALGKRRREAVVCTKISPSNAYPAVMRAHCEASLRRLGTDYIDLYMLHWPINKKSVEHFSNNPDIVNNPPVIAEAFDTLIKLRREGKIREIGVSNHGAEQLEEIKQTNAAITVDELTYNIFSRAIEDSIVSACISSGIGIIGSMTLQQGLLTGMFKSPGEVPAHQAHSRHFHYSRGGSVSRHGGDGCEAEMFLALESLEVIAAELGISIAQLSIAWAISKPFICCSLVGSRNINELKSNMAALEFPLDANIVDEIDRLSNPVLKKLGNNPDYYECEQNTRIW